MEEATRVLLVEDNPADARYVQEILREVEGARFVLRRAGTMKDALGEIGKGDVDAVLLDLGLPDSKGLDTLDGILRDCPTLPIIVLTGLDDHQVGMDAIRMGAQDYIVKGRFEAESLRRAIDYAIDRQASFNLLHEHLEFQQQMIDALPIPVFYLDRMLVVIGCNAEFETFMGRSRHDMLGRMVGEVVPTDLIHAFDPVLPEEPQEERREEVVTLKDAKGSTHRLVMRRSVSRDREGHPTGLVVTFIPEAAFRNLAG